MKFPFPHRLSLLILLAGVVFNLNGQFDQDEVCKIARLEAEAVAKKMSFQSHGLAANYDLIYQRMEWEVDPDVRFISGAIHSRFATTEDLDHMYFDLNLGMVVDSVVYRGEKASFTHQQNDLLQIELNAQLSAGTADSLTVYYHGVPPLTGLGAFTQTNHQGDGIIWTLSEPYGAKDWWPCKQDLQDKIDSVDIFITCPAGNKAGSNGSLEGVDTLANGKLRFHWKHRYPIPAYLVALAVTNYAEFSDYADLSEGRLEILNYVFPEHLSTLEEDAKRVIPLLELYDSLIGPYPYMKEKYGHAQFGWGGGMEHATMSFMASLAYELVAHELAHQWFGDKVTCGSWSDIWLNEGFATYLTGLSYEYVAPSLWSRWKAINIERVTRDPGGSVYVEDTTDINRIFSSRLTYYKGALVLHMLRWKLGDKAFYQALRNYISDPRLAYGFARTTDLQRHLEQGFGGSLEEFFEDWYYGEGYPTYFIQWSQENGRMLVRMAQSSSHPSVDFFEMPVPLYVSGEGKDSILVLHHTTDNQLFARDLGFRVDSVAFDPEQWLVARLGYIKKVSDLAGQSIAPILYPNPARQQVKLSGYWDKLQIIDQQGQLVRTITNSSIANDEVELDITYLRAGTYFLRFGEEVKELVVVP